MEVKVKEKKNFREKVQKMGSFLSEMIMPNIGAFVAWGLISAIFVENGWYPNATLAEMMGPLLRWLIPILVAYTAGYNIYSKNGGVVASIASMGAIMSSESPMFMAVMVIAPITAFIYKKIDMSIEGKIKPGFEMLVNTSIMGILGAVISIIAYLSVGPFFEALSYLFMTGVDFLMSKGMFPFISIIAEPAKVLFLNNALYYGVLLPIGMNQISAEGSTILFWAVANLGTGLGVLLAYLFFGKGTSKQAAPGAIIIHVFGGIHEMYFPYVLKNPLHLISITVSGFVGLAFFSFFNVGFIASPPVGSIIAILAVIQKSRIIWMLLGVTLTTCVSFAISSIIVKAEKPEKDLTNEGNEINNSLSEKAMVTDFGSSKVKQSKVKNIVFACDAGQGSSAMGAALLRKKIKDHNIEGVTVKNYAISNIPKDADLIVTHIKLADRAKSVNPDAIYVLVDNFLANDKYEEVIKRISKD